MKALFFSCVLSLIFSEKTLYNQLLTGILEGANLISNLDSENCFYSPPLTSQDKKFSINWDNLIQDLTEISLYCKFEEALKPLKNLKTSNEMMNLANKKFEEAKAKNQFPASSDMNNFGKNLGSWLSQYIRMASPSAFKFSYNLSDISFSKKLAKTPLPIAYFHGINGNCKDDVHKEWETYLRNKLGVYIKCIEIGDGALSSIFWSMTKQTDEACKKIKADPNYKTNFNLIGISQGGIIARGVLQYCAGLKVNNLITIGTPNMGVNKIPDCEVGFECYFYNKAAKLGAYSAAFQELGPGGYFKDQFNYETYLKESSFLADLNNEKGIKKKYIDLYSSLGYFVQVYFEQDTTVIPKESETFGYFALNSNQIQPYNETLNYVYNYLGAKTMEAQGKIIRVNIDAGHCNMTQPEVDKYIIPYLL